MEVVCTGKKIILFFIYSHDKFLALSLLNPLEKILESPLAEGDEYNCLCSIRHGCIEKSKVLIYMLDRKLECCVLSMRFYPKKKKENKMFYACILYYISRKQILYRLIPQVMYMMLLFLSLPICMIFCLRKQ